MSSTSNNLTGAGKDLGGKVKETAGDVTGSGALQRAGLSDQISGKAQKALGSAQGFAKQRPFAAAALAGVVGLAFLNTLRGKR